MIELRKNIEEKWVGCKKENGKIQVFFELGSGGQLLDLRLVRGIEDSDSEYSALNAVEAVFPCVTPPVNSKSSLKILATFDCDPRSRSQDHFYEPSGKDLVPEKDVSSLSESYSNDDIPYEHYPPVQSSGQNAFSNQLYHPQNQYLPNTHFLPQQHNGDYASRFLPNHQPYYQAPAELNSAGTNFSRDSKQNSSNHNWQSLNQPNNYQEKLPAINSTYPDQNSQNLSLPSSKNESSSDTLDTRSNLKENDWELTPNDLNNLSTSPSRSNSNDLSERASSKLTKDNSSSYGQKSSLVDSQQNNLWLFPAALSFTVFLLSLFRKKTEEKMSTETVLEDEEEAARIDSIEVELEDFSPDEIEVVLEDKSQAEQSVGIATEEINQQFQPQELENDLRLDETFIKFLEQSAVRIVTDFEISQGRKVRDVSLENLGYDLISSNETEERLIEVKGKARKGIVLVTPNEWKTAQTKSNAYYLYIVEDLLSKKKTLKIIQNPCSQMTPDSSRYLYVLQRNKYLNSSELIPTKIFLKGEV